MTELVKVIPVFHQNVETAGIVSGNEIEMPMNMPNQSKVFISSPATSISQTSINFQVPNVSSFLDSNMELRVKCKVVLRGSTVQPSAGPPAVGTPPYLWSPYNGGVAQLGLNKAINYLSFNIANKQWTETNGRNDPEMIDIYAAQFDQDKLAEYGIFPFENAGVVLRRRVNGGGLFTRGQIETMFPATLAQYGYSANLATNGEESNERAISKNNQYFYLEIDQSKSGFIASDGTPLVTRFLGETEVQNQDFGALSMVPYNATTGALYYSGAVNTITQTVEFYIREYIISPNLSNPYTKNSYRKTYPTLGYPFNLQLNLNSDYMKHFFVVLPKMMAAVSGGRTTLVSSEIVGANLNVYTFDAEKARPDTTRILYSYVDKQTVPSVVNSYNNPTVMSAKVATSNLTSLPPYILLYVTTRMWENPDYTRLLLSGEQVAAPHTLGNILSCIPQNIEPYVLNPITRVEISFGSQSDVVWGVDATIKELQDLTLETLQNPKLRKVIANQLRVRVAQSITDTSDPFAQNLGFWHPNGFATGCPFLLLDTTKLNFKPLPNASDIPLIPNFNMGSQNYRSLTVSMNWTGNQDMLHSIDALPTSASFEGLRDNLNIRYEPVVALITQRIRSIPLSGTGVMADDLVEYDFMTDKEKLKSIIKDFAMTNLSSSIGNQQLQFVGGAGFWSNLGSKILSALPYVIKGVHTASNLLKTMGKGKRQ